MTTPYTTGQISLVNGEALVTGIGTAWETALIIGGTIYVEADGGNALPIAEIASDTELTSAIAWTGPTGTYDYALVRDTAYGQQTVANAQALAEYIQRLNNTTLSAVAGVNAVADTLLLFTGPDTATTIPLAGLINGADYDVQVNNLAGRAVYDNSAANFRVLVSDIGDGRAAIYSKKTNAAGDWSAAAVITGATGPAGATPTIAATASQLAAGGAPTATVSPVTGGVSIAFGIPAGRTSGFPYRWSTTTTDANPGNGFIRANNTALGSATLLFVSKTSQAGSAMATFLLAMAAADNAVKGTLILQRVTDGQTVSFNVTGVTDATNYVKVAVSGQSGLTAIANNADLNFLFTQAGNKGSDGTGAGTVTSVAVSVPTGLQVGGSPITSNGTIAITYQSGYQGFTSAQAAIIAGLGNAASRNVGTTTGTVAAGDDARFSQGGSSQNEAIFALEIADLKGSRLGMKGGVADAFDDETGVDIKTNAAYDAANDWYTPSPTSFVNQTATHNSATVSGNTASASSSIGAGYEAWRAFDRIASTSANDNLWASNNTTSAWLQYQFATAKTITSYSIKSGAVQTVRSPSSWTLMGSNTGAFSGEQTILDTRTSENGWTAGQIRRYAITSPNSFLYYRLNVTAVDGGTLVQVDELTLDIGGSLNNMTLVSIAYPLPSVPTNARLLLQTVEFDTAVANTDFVAEFSRDNGTTWTAGNLVLSPYLVAGNYKMYEAQPFSVASQPNGSAMKWRVRTLTNKNIAISGIVSQGA